MQHDGLAAQAAGTSAPLVLPQPERLALPDGAVQVWRLEDAQVDPACTRLAHTLAPDERARALAYRHARHCHGYIARRGLLRWLVGGYLHCRPEALRFTMSAFGKPVLQWPQARLAFSVSHTDGLALLAFALDCCLGVDVERRAGGVNVAEVPGFGRGIFSAQEAQVLARARPASADALLSIWTRKEALLKALGTGFSADPTGYTTEDDWRRGAGHWRASHHGTSISAGWTCLDLDAGAGFRAALAVSLPDASVTWHRC
ncbi:putative 4'-phosphopantetheinyl transferase superfamily protein [Cupriavidus taiwanensis]|uniref:4'-phosphopantetheinyl transferase family protein n=1 Tax=Cupriavidus taiwanensis TaxID=164546 RepID=UPI000E10534A|nr:4'-phosphopantetheinyl transferase superfamily protein [Cupriavidus taiwanensis]SPA40802.1 putative 4'-phosphopantetheinyl transferase superfamily protein [Cupriavidus taiwanensis]SPA41729.1 putative 4'-phosphopantetheinyl transferase superfamily protein [Cupriavidus taiwanensis]